MDFAGNGSLLLKKEEGFCLINIIYRIFEEKKTGDGKNVITFENYRLWSVQWRLLSDDCPRYIHGWCFILTESPDDDNDITISRVSDYILLFVLQNVPIDPMYCYIFRKSAIC